MKIKEIKSEQNEITEGYVDAKLIWDLVVEISKLVHVSPLVIGTALCGVLTGGIVMAFKAAMKTHKE